MVGGDWCGAGGLAWLAEQQGEWLLGVAEGTLGLIGKLADKLYVTVGAAISIVIACSNLLQLRLVSFGAVGLLHNWYVQGGLWL